MVSIIAFKASLSHEARHYLAKCVVAQMTLGVPNISLWFGQWRQVESICGSVLWTLQVVQFIDTQSAYWDPAHYKTYRTLKM